MSTTKVGPAPRWKRSRFQAAAPRNFAKSHSPEFSFFHSKVLRCYSTDPTRNHQKSLERGLCNRGSFGSWEPRSVHLVTGPRDRGGNKKPHYPFPKSPQMADGPNRLAQPQKLPDTNVLDWAPNKRQKHDFVTQPTPAMPHLPQKVTRRPAPNRLTN